MVIELGDDGLHMSGGASVLGKAQMTPLSY